MTALGLRGRHKSVIVADNVANRGQIFKVQHLVEAAVQPVGTKAVSKPAPLKKTKAEQVQLERKRRNI